ncbi:MAG: TusE/DsrC/DsvC family sulfur relay protein, partial [Plesiomonas sp.]
MLEYQGHQIETDAKGYLKNSQDWHEALADLIAQGEGITLSPAHWEVV